MVRIQMFSWMTFSTQITAGTVGNFQCQIPVSVTPMKSIFFGMTNFSRAKDMNYLKTGFNIEI